MTDPATAHLRPGTVDDNRACFFVLHEAYNDFAHRTGTEGFALDDPEGAWHGIRPFFDHLAETAAEFWVALDRDGGEVIGYARSIERDGLFELTEFFVLPSLQASGLGGALLERAFPRGRGTVRLIIATTDLRALSRYLRSGVLARVPICSFIGSSHPVHVETDLEIERLEAGGDLGEVDTVDDAVLGHRRTVDHRWLRGEREAYAYRRGGTVVGYGYVGLPDGGGSGPFAVLDSADLPAALAHAESRRAELGAPETSFDVALDNRVAIDHLLGRRYRMDNVVTLLLSSEPLGRLDGYVFTAPPLIL